MTSQERPSVLIVAFSRLSRDPRVLRQIDALHDRYDLTAAGFGRIQTAADVVVVSTEPDVSRSSRIRDRLELASRAYSRPGLSSARHVAVLKSQLRGRRFDLVLANDPETLPLAFDVADGSPVVLDAHEYWPSQGDESWRWRTFRRPRIDFWLRSYLPRLSGMLTVNDVIADQYWTSFGVRPDVWRNAPKQFDLSPSPTLEGSVRLIHHGVARAARRPELMLEVMDMLDERFSLDLMLVASDESYLSSFGAAIGSRARVRLVEPVPTEQIVPRTQSYDLGLFLLPPTNGNYANALPNKFFEFVQARLGVAIGPTPPMRQIVADHDLGVVSEDFTPRSLAKALNRLSLDDIVRFKSNAHKAAAVLNAETEAENLRRVVQGALERG